MCRRAGWFGGASSVVDVEGKEAEILNLLSEENRFVFQFPSCGSRGSVSDSDASSTLAGARHAIGSRSSGCVAKIPGWDSLLKIVGIRGSRCVENHSIGRLFQAEIILLSTLWYLRYSLSYRDLEEMMSERGLSVDHTTIKRWVQKFAPELGKCSRPHLKPTNDSWRVDETHVKIKDQWMYLYRAVDSTGQMLYFILNETPSTLADKRFFRKVLVV